MVKVLLGFSLKASSLEGWKMICWGVLFCAVCCSLLNPLTTDTRTVDIKGALKLKLAASKPKLSEVKATLAHREPGAKARAILSL